MIPDQAQIHGHIVRVREFAERCVLELLRPSPEPLHLVAYLEAMREHQQKAARLLARAGDRPATR